MSHLSRRWLTFSVGCSALVAVAAPAARAQTSAPAIGNATVTPTGPRTGTNGVNFFNVEGSGNAGNADFGVLDFAASAFNPGGQTANGIAGNTLTLRLTESDAAFTKPGTLEFYLTTNTAASISNAAGASTLKYQPGTVGAFPANDPPYGIDPLLGSQAGNTLFDLGSGAFTTTGNTATGQADTYTLTLGNASALSAFLAQLNTSGGNLRLVAAITSDVPGGAATFFGVGNGTASNRPTLSFTPTFATANGLYRQTTSGAWTPTGGTDWATTAAGPGAQGWTNDGTATAFFTRAPTGTITISAGNISAAGLQFDVSGYTIAGATAADTLTLTGAHLVTVTNAADTATISAPVAGTAGLSKLGAGTLALTGANGFTGAVNLLAGTLAVGADNALGNAANEVALNGGTLRATGNLALNANRGLTGSGGGLDVPAGSTLTINGVVNTGNLNLLSAGTVILSNTAGVAGGGSSSNTLGVVTFNAAGTTLSAPKDGSGIPGVTQLGGATIPASVTSGTATISSSVFLAAGSTNTFTVAAAGATLAVNGSLTGGGVFVQAGPGTVVLNGDNSTLTGVVRQGGGGTLVIPATNQTASPLGTGQLQANGGTLQNNTGAALALPNGISLGASNAAATPGGFVVAGNAPVSFAGSVGLFGTVARTLTTNTPTTLAGGLAQVANTAGASLILAGSSTLTLASTSGASTLAVPVTVATTGSGGVVASAVGTFASVPTLSVVSLSVLTIDGGATSGANATDALNDAGLLSLMAGGGSFGRVALTLSGALETVGGLQLGAADTFQLNGGGTAVLPAGLAPAGTYGAIGSGATYQSNDYFVAGSGGQLLNAATAVPEPSTWLLSVLGAGGMLAGARRFRSRPVC